MTQYMVRSIDAFEHKIAGLISIVALTRFKRTLYFSRRSVRELTCTLHLPPAHAEIYGGPHSEWLRDCLERLPRLQSLIVNGLPFFDHASLLTLRHSSQWSPPSAFPIFSLRLLDASGCSNATSTGLSEALLHLPDLVSLDLSSTSAAKHASVLSRLKALPNLRTLKLKGLGLKDTDIDIIASSVGNRLRSLDVSSNHLTDISARLLLQYCLKNNSYETHNAHPNLAPLEHIRPFSELDIFGTEDLDSHIRKKLTRGFVGSLAIEDARDVGLTHLYLSNNYMTVEGISGLLRSKRLQALDVGTLPITFQRRNYASLKEYGPNLVLPGVEKLTHTLAQYASQKLVYLRVNFGLVTKDAPLDMHISSPAEIEGDLGPYNPSNAHELAGVELSSRPSNSAENGIYELPGDTLQPTELPESSRSVEVTPRFNGDDYPIENTVESKLNDAPPAPIIEVTPESRETRQVSMYDPIPDNGTLPLSPVSPIVDSSRGLSIFMNISDRRSKSPSVDSDDGIGNSGLRRSSTSYTEDLRASLDLRQSQENRLHPGMLPKVHTLVLTDVPTKVSDGEIINRLIQFIKDCASEAEIARLRAQHTYMLPPGRSRTVAERQYTRSIFALRRIVFEMAPSQTAAKKISTSWRQYPTKSSTEDTDSEAFWEAAAHDFSFFGDEECGLPNAEPGRHLPLAAMDGLMVDTGESEFPSKPTQSEIGSIEPAFDVVAEIGAFRRERKAAHQAATRLGNPDAFVEGYWPGDITVVRKPVDGEAGSVDYYGNRFQGWLYR